MVRTRFSVHRARIRDRLEAAFTEDHPPRDVAATFSFGLFVGALPNFGVALVLFAVVARSVDRVSNLALVAAMVVMNPPVKWLIYGGGFWVGSRLLGPVPVASSGLFSPAAGQAAFVRVFVGSAVIAAVLAVVGYVLALRAVRELRRRDVDLSEPVAEVVSK